MMTRYLTLLDSYCDELSTKPVVLLFLITVKKLKIKNIKKSKILSSGVGSRIYCLSHFLFKLCITGNNSQPFFRREDQFHSSRQTEKLTDEKMHRVNVYER